MLLLCSDLERQTNSSMKELKSPELKNNVPPLHHLLFSRFFISPLTPPIGSGQLHGQNPMSRAPRDVGMASDELPDCLEASLTRGKVQGRLPVARVSASKGPERVRVCSGKN